MYVHKVASAFFRPCKLVESGFIESLNGQMRDELLNTELSFSLQDTREKLSCWVDDYITIQPHLSLNNLTFHEFLTVGNAES